MPCRQSMRIRGMLACGTASLCLERNSHARQQQASKLWHSTTMDRASHASASRRLFVAASPSLIRLRTDSEPDCGSDCHTATGRKAD